MDFLLIALLTLLNGLFAMSELALASSRKLRLQSLADGGDKGARQALALLQDPTQFLSSVQVGITSIGMVNGIVGEAAFSADLGQWLLALGTPAKAAELTATAAVVLGITFVTIVFGELVPKRIGQLYPEQVARLVARPMAALARLAGPFVRLLALSTQAVLGVLRIDNKAARAVTEEEIAASLNEGHEAGVIEDDEHQLVQNVFRLDDRPLTSLMVPRSEVQWLSADLAVAQALRLAGRDGGRGAHSWYPVCQGSLDEVVGVVSVAQLLSLQADAAQPLRACAQPAHFLPETLSGLELLEQLRQGAGRFVFVVDEYGVVQGIMTPRDLLEAITGELLPSAHSEAWALQRDDGSWLLDGQMPITELKARLDIRDLPDENRGRYNTLAGLLLTVSGHLPTLGERIVCTGWEFEVVDLDGRRIDKVLAQWMGARYP
ncbi:HlyC/CorC family transporter [Acidovorax sp. HDW3]|uniref:hemolysin family protein n=1 Tax=Acidovorax sp. HDW3 TaxID=2714923 RepID=UPI00140D3337|nr:hemolysin family protein [Acidovorax sp. HDW3]QIL44508.1 HlyC/CorC family transporter [Acidovorax sp. HDW3]